MTSRGARIVRVLVRAWAHGLLEGGLWSRGPRIFRAAVARRLRVAFEELGPAFIKLGQVVSVRPDVFSPEVSLEMASLRDAVPPMPFSEVRSVFRSEFGREPHEVFADFEEAPIAAASVAQVHRARLREPVLPSSGGPVPAGAQVAVKILRPDVRESLLRDLDIVRGLLAGRLARLVLRRAEDILPVLDEVENAVLHETDMRSEGRTADGFALDFRDEPAIRVPRVIWRHTGRRVLTLEYVTGWRLSALDEAERAGVDCERLARLGAVAFMRQVLVNGRFHADLHPSNLLVTPDERIAYLDFGIVGTLSREEREEVAGILSAIVADDPAAALAASERLGLVVPPRSREAVLSDLAALMRTTLGDDRDVKHFGLGLLRVLRRHRVRIPRGYGLLVKALVTVEGVSRALYPDIDIIGLAARYTAALESPRVLYSSLRAALRLPVR